MKQKSRGTPWTPMKRIKPQQRYARSKTRFNVVYAGRRSGKTEIAKRRVVMAALKFTAFTDGYFIMGAPTYQQAKKLFWADLKRLVPPYLRLVDPREGELSITLVNGATIACIGLDKPERHEGRPIDGGVLDEYGNMKPEVWKAHLRPALDTPGRPGWLDFIGVPEGRNHFYDLARAAQADTTGAWSAHHWKSSIILSPEQLEAAKADLDELTYRQEYEADFVSFQGQAYYPFDEAVHAQYQLPYDPNAVLNLCLDFNRSPGTASVTQEIENFKRWANVAPKFTGVIGEVHIPSNSNTKIVAQRLIDDWGDHKGEVHLHGDATGGIQGSAKLDGSDWDIVDKMLRPVFGDRLIHRYPRANPPERSRVNSMNSRLLTMDDVVHLLVDRTKAPNVVKDFEGVRVVEGGSGQIDKKHDLRLTHLTDGLGYYVHDRFPFGGGGGLTVEEVY